ALAAYKLAPLPWTVVQAAGMMALAAIGLGAAVGGWRPVGRDEAARFLDQRAGLQERVSTALEMSRGESAGRWRELLVADARARVAAVDPRRLLPVGLPGFVRWTVLGLALCAGLGFVPEYRTAQQRQQAADRAVIQDVGRNLVQLSKRDLTRKAAALENTRKSLENVGELGERLQAAPLTRQEALKDLAKATEGLRQQALDLAKNPALRKLEQAARNSGGTSPSTREALQKQIDSLQKSLGEKANGEAARELQKDLAKLKEAAKGLADKDGKAGETARAEMAKALSELSQKAADQGIPLESLNDAAEALRNAQVEQFLKDLQVAEKDLEQMAQMAKQLAQLQQQAEKMGKDLAEPLQNGQAQAAAETLRKMVEALRKSDLTPDQLKKLAEEAARGAQPGEQYGKVGELLKKAAQQAQQGQKGDAGKSLAEAQKELENLMEQMADAQSLMASLQALQKAQMCVGNGQCWGQGNGSGNRVGLSQKGRGGKGVGMWSDNDAWAMPEGIQELWDNSGVNRPDVAGRGLTERDATQPDGLVPTKIKGQMQPGGPMPSITLRGVHLKGESRVSYTEAIATAQSDAQSALNQEQVPKAYKNAVRDYFGELK
ncbi:MAG: hypothetical protein ACKOET_20580, partial [Verrucomicrobiota bacterium]